MKLKKAYKRFVKNPSLKNEVAFNYALDLWRKDRLAYNFLALDRPEVQPAILFKELSEGLKSKGEAKLKKVTLQLENNDVKVFVKGKPKSIKKIEKQVFSTSLNKEVKGFDYKVWVVAKYLT
jgi:hypothetical protein